MELGVYEGMTTNQMFVIMKRLIADCYRTAHPCGPDGVGHSDAQTTRIEALEEMLIRWMNVDIDDTGFLRSKTNAVLADMKGQS